MKKSAEELFFRGYIECAIWSSIDDDGEPLDRLYSIDDIAADSLRAMREDCDEFLVLHPELASFEHVPGCNGEWSLTEQAGHDFWLTRNGHGAGFWDRGNLYGSDGEKERYTESAHAFGESNLYIGDDGEVYAS